ncbi:MAG: hypothetical protein AD742_01260 [Methylibium sp. NZG]|nr:MAG: hypothetical protein AD742_01260 [Methylibium sp. NZG]
MNQALNAAIERFGQLPGILQWREKRFDRAFAANRLIGTSRGIFDTHAQAARAAPTSRPTGYDDVDSSGLYQDRLKNVFPGDYPMMLWLQRVFNDGARKVFDLGGNIGLAYYAYQRLVDFPDDVSWCVNDVGPIVQAGEREALVRDPQRRLRFTQRFEDASDADVLFTSGCIQYLQHSLADQLAALPRRPRWLLVNLVPLHERWDFWTVQSIGSAFCPYRIQHSKTFFADLDRLGYAEQDRWEALDRECWIAFEPERSLDRYHGAAFKLR